MTHTSALCASPSSTNASLSKSHLRSGFIRKRIRKRVFELPKILKKFFTVIRITQLCWDVRCRRLIIRGGRGSKLLFFCFITLKPGVGGWGFGFRYKVFGFRVSGFGSRVSCAYPRIQKSAPAVKIKTPSLSKHPEGQESRVSCSGGFWLWVSGFGFRISDFWIRFPGFGFRVSDLHPRMRKSVPAVKRRGPSIFAMPGGCRMTEERRSPICQKSIVEFLRSPICRRKGFSES